MAAHSLAAATPPDYLLPLLPYISSASNFHRKPVILPTAGCKTDEAMLGAHVHV